MKEFADWYFETGWMLACALGFASTWVYGLRVGYLIVVPIVFMAIVGRYIV